MRSQSDIDRRLRSLRVKYAKRYIARSQARVHTNCVFNAEHTPRNFIKSDKSDKSEELKLVPRRQVTLVVLRPELPIRLCMYGSQDMENWPGIVCDSDDVAKSCPMFKSKQSLDDSRAEFMEKLSDDEWVFDNHKDMAALQWVLNDRLHKMDLKWWELLYLWFHSIVLRRSKPIPQLTEPNIPTDLWDDK